MIDRLNEAVAFDPYRFRIGGRVLSRFLKDQSGTTAIEYCMIACGISIVIVTAAIRIGNSLITKYYGPIGSAFN